jgi:hypothetical protein
MWVSLSALTCAAHPAVPGDGVVVLNKYAFVLQKLVLIESIVAAKAIAKEPQLWVQ